MSKKMKYWLVTLAGVIVGGGIGFLIGEGVGDNMKSVESTFAGQAYLLFSYDIVFYLMATTCLVLLVLVLGGLRKLKSYSSVVADDEPYSPIEKAVSTLMMQATLLQSISTVWLFAGASYMTELADEDRILGVLMISSAIMLLIGWLLFRKVMSKMNELVPRLAIDLYDTNQNRQYNSVLKRLDESEKLQMYKAGFQAMRWMLTVLYILLFVIMIYSVLIESQMNLLLLVGFLTITQQAFYFYAAKQQTKSQRLTL